MNLSFSRLTVLSIALLLFMPRAGYSAILLDWQGNDAGIILRGEIKPETNFELVEAWAEIHGRGGSPLALILDSPGGSVYWAEKISTGLTSIRYPAMVLGHGLCASACFLILAAAPRKMIATTALVAIHSASINGEESADSYAATMDMARQAASYGIPDALIGKLVRTPGYDIAPLSAAEIESIPGADVAWGRDSRAFTARAVAIDDFMAGYAAGGFIAARLSYMTSCASFTDATFLRGCVKGLTDRPPPGWDQRFR